MKTLMLTLSLALLLAGGAWGHAWLDSSRAKHPAVDAFETFYWKLQRNDLAAAGALVVPGSEADLALIEKRSVGVAAELGTARGFALELELERDTEKELSGREAIRLSGRATVNIDPAGHLSAFGVPELHEVEAHLVEIGPAVGAHAGPGTLVVGLQPAPL